MNFLEIFHEEVFHYVHLEKVLQKNLGTDRAREECIFKILPLDANHGGAFLGSMYVPVCPQKTLDTPLSSVFISVLCIPSRYLLVQSQQ